jgi:hypothetical protein
MQAMALLKELVTHDLVDPNYVSIGERQNDGHQLQIKTKYNRTELERFCKEKNCLVEEDKEERYLVIYKR